MTINQIIIKLLNESPDKILSPSDLAPKVWELQNDLDKRMVMKNFRSMLQRGVKDKLWDRAGRALYKAKSSVAQGQLINA
jgi:hypothetical protein